MPFQTPSYREDRSPGYDNTIAHATHQFWQTSHPVRELLWPRCVYESRRRGSWTLRRIGFPWLRIELMLEGELCYEVNGVRRISRAGELHFTPVGGDVLLIGNPNHPCRRIGLELGGQLLNSLNSQPGLAAAWNAPASESGTSETELRQLYRLLAEKQTGTETQISRICYAIVLALGERAATARSPALPERLSELLNFIHAHLAEPLSAQQLARRIGATPPTLTRLFRAHLGTPPMEYVANCRLDHARQLLEFGEHSVKEIAAELGYGNAFHFSRAFRQRFGTPPSLWRAPHN